VRLQWDIPKNTADAIPVIHPSGKVMFIVFASTTTDNTDIFKGRWTFYGNIATGKIDFVLRNITKEDAGKYSWIINNEKKDGVTLVVYCEYFSTYTWK